MKRFSLYVMIAVILFLPGCGTLKNNSFVNNNDTQLVLPLSLNPVSFDPRRLSYMRDHTLLQHIFSGLYKRDINGTYIPKLVDRVEISEDQKTYTFHLKKTLWSDHTPLTAYDIRDSWLQVLSPNFPSPYSYLFSMIKNAKEAKNGLLPLSEVGITAPSDYCLIVDLCAPTPHFFNFLSFPTTYPVHKSQRDAGIMPVNDLISNGAFILKDWVPESSILLEKNPFYVEAENVSLSSVMIKIIKNAPTAILMFQRGEVDWIGWPWYDNILPEAFEKFKLTGQLKSVPMEGTHWLICNTTSPCLSSVKIRKALSMSINRDEIISQVTKSFFKPAYRILPPNLAPGPISNPAIMDLKQSKILFEEALNEMGLTRKDFSKLSLSYIGNEYFSRICELIYKQWEENLDIHVKLDPCEFKHYLHKRDQGPFDFVLGGWLDDLNDAQPFLETFKSKKDPDGTVTGYFSRWVTPAYDNLLQQALITTDMKKRSQYFIEAEECMMQDMPLLPLYYRAMDYALNDRVSNIVIFDNGFVDFSNATITKR